MLRIPETTMGDNDVPVAVRSHLVQAASGPTEAAGGGDDFAWFYDEDTYENAAPILMHEEEEEACQGVGGDVSTCERGGEGVGWWV